MTELPIVGVDFEGARQLADFYSIRQDLVFVRDCVRRLVTLSKTDALERSVDSRALWDAALIAYRRCFNRKSILYTDLEGHPSDPLILHRHIHDQASKLVAHSVNAYEQGGVGVALTPEDRDPKAVIGIAWLGQRLVGWREKDLRQFEKLTNLVLTNLVAPKIAELEAQVTSFARNIPIDELYARPRLTLTTPGPSDAGKRRR